jgi:hypothetical protein
MALGLDPGKGSRRPEFSLDTAEFVLEYFRSPHRHGSAQLPPSSIGKLDEFT